MTTYLGLAKQLGLVIHMYCPKCAEPNNDEVKFCRACGENLTVIAQAMSKHMPIMLISKLDQYVARKNERLRRDGVMTGLTGLFLLISGIWQLSSNAGALLPAIFMFVGALIMFMMSLWDLLAYRRSFSQGDQSARAPSVLATGELEAQSSEQSLPASVTEQTTRHLEKSMERSS